MPLMYRTIFLLVLSGPIFLTGCASITTSSPSLVRPAQIENTPFVLNGRIAVKHNGWRTSATFRWTHHADQDEILMFAPLGQTAARIQKNVAGVTLDTSDKHYAAPDAESLTQQVLGWSLPLAGLRYWIFALPAPGSTFEMQSESNGQVSQLLQDQWAINYTRYATAAPDSLPLRMTLQRDELSIQLLIDEWEVSEVF